MRVAGDDSYSQLFAAPYTMFSGFVGKSQHWAGKPEQHRVTESYAEEGILCLSWVMATGHVY